MATSIPAIAAGGANTSTLFPDAGHLFQVSRLLISLLFTALDVSRQSVLAAIRGPLSCTPVLSWNLLGALADNVYVCLGMEP